MKERSEIICLKLTGENREIVSFLVGCPVSCIQYAKSIPSSSVLTYFYIPNKGAHPPPLCSYFNSKQITTLR